MIAVDIVEIDIVEIVVDIVVVVVVAAAGDIAVIELESAVELYL